MSDLRTRFGRRLRLGMIGGGPDSWIGRMHQGAAQLDGWWEVAAGVFSSDPARSRAAGTAVGVDAERSYGDVAEMIALERARPDGIDGVAIMTPNDTHYPFAVAALEAGLDVIADKPVSYNAAEARDLAARARAGGRLFAVTHGYAAYPMTRLASRLVCGGEIGALRLVQVEYIQGGLAAKIEDGPQTTRIRWLFDPSRSGLAQVMSAIGCHAQHLACFVTGRGVTRVAAEVGTVVPGRRVADHVSALVEFEGGIKGTFTAFQAAAGAENDIRLRVYGERGMVEWSHRECSYLRLSMHGEPARVIGRGDPGLPPEIIRAGRSPRGHPEGLLQAFANIYGEVAQERMAMTLGDERPSFVYPRIEDGVHTMAFIEACLASQAAGGWVTVG
ncbi:MAG TPA: Gfo/Idh/MocA family oxidoreductase [Vicinamibacterales bacterium]|nr:Gfo/Idh/MocA family oxidoreductase [Vicinamibacterales bacterium]